MGRKTSVEYRVYDGADALSRAAAEHFLETAQAAVAARGRARIAISGGSTPKRTFELLANPAERYLKAMPWEQMELDWVDERCVPPDHPDSNYRMTREAMLSKVPLKREKVFRIEGEFEPDEAAAGTRAPCVGNSGWKAQRCLDSMCLPWAWGMMGTRRRCFHIPPPFTNWCGSLLRITYRSRRNRGE